MVPDATFRRLVGEYAERIAMYLLIVLVGLLATRTVLAIESPLDLTALAAVVATILFGAQVVRPTRGGWAPAFRTGVTARRRATLPAVPTVAILVSPAIASEPGGQSPLV